MSGWQPIETAPKDGTRVLIATPATTALPGLERFELTPPWRFAVAWWDREFRSDGWDEESDGPNWISGWNAGRVGSWGMEEYFEETPTHWQPLPEPPEGA